MNIFELLSEGHYPEDAEATEYLGSLMAKAAPADTAIALSGDLGTGKTTFVRGMARALGITSNVHSPTYTIYTLYSGTRQLLHMDAYRLEGAHDIEQMDLDDLLLSPFLIAVEWPERAKAFLDEFPCLWLSFEIVPGKGHRITLTRQHQSQTEE